MMNVDIVSQERSASSRMDLSTPQSQPIKIETLADKKKAELINNTTMKNSAEYMPRSRSPGEAPLRKLSVGLLKTYQNINQVYYADKLKQEQQQQQQQKKIYNNGWDDEKSDLIITIGETWMDRYTVISMLGQGSFGQVVKAFDKKENEYVAIKAIKNKTPFYNQGLIEIRLLQHMAKKDPEDKFSVVKMKHHFMFKNHLCLVFELLSCNLFDLIRNTQFQGVSLNLVRKFAFQIARSLYFLSLSDVDVLHCDLKPENILLRNPKRSAIKIIDFGSSCHSDQRLFKYIQSRFYRSPEVILELEYKHPIDMWSLGCILVELHVGEPTFPGRSESEMMTKFVEILGMPPADLLDRSPKAKKFFNLVGVDEFGNKKYELRANPNWKKRELSSIIGTYTSGPGSRRLGENFHSLTDYLKFQDLVEKMLTWDPAKRITPLAALSHPFFQPILQEKGAEKTESPTAHNNPTPTKSSAEASNKLAVNDAMMKD